jgi:hypothetical protein
MIHTFLPQNANNPVNREWPLVLVKAHPSLSLELRLDLELRLLRSVTEYSLPRVKLKIKCLGENQNPQRRKKKFAYVPSG